MFGLRRSQRCRVGDRWWSHAATSCVLFTGFHATAEQLFIRLHATVGYEDSGSTPGLPAHLTNDPFKDFPSGYVSGQFTARQGWTAIGVQRRASRTFPNLLRACAVSKGCPAQLLAKMHHIGLLCLRIASPLVVAEAHDGGLLFEVPDRHRAGSGAGGYDVGDLGVPSQV